LVSDDAFALSMNIMKPFPGTYPKGSPERAYNYRLSRARRTIENVFGLLAAVFIIFRKPIPLQPQKTETVVLACIHLHNFVRRNIQSIRSYTPPGTFDRKDTDTGDIIPGAWRAELGEMGLLELQSVPRRSSENAMQVRNKLANYFVSDRGRAPWQGQFA
jgi:hypothetical protein